MKVAKPTQAAKVSPRNDGNRRRLERLLRRMLQTTRSQFSEQEALARVPYRRVIE